MVRTTAVVLFTGFLLAPPAASADISSTAIHFVDLGPETARGIAVTNGLVWVSSGDRVRVYEPPYLRPTANTLSGLPGAAGITGTRTTGTVFVAVGGEARIAEFDTETCEGCGIVVPARSFPTAACPADVAEVGHFLFYSTGCAGSAGRVSSIDLTDGSPGPSLAGSFPAAARLRGSRTVLAVLTAGKASLYTVADDGTLTTLFTDRNNARDLAISDDGTQYAQAGPVISRSPVDPVDPVDPDGQTPAPPSGARNVDTVSYPTGWGDQRVAAAVDDTLYVFPGPESEPTGRAEGFGTARIVTGSLRFHTAMTGVFGLATDPRRPGHSFLLTAFPGGGSTPVQPVAVRITGPSGWNRPFTVSLHASSQPDHPVTVVLDPARGATREYRASTDSNGRARLTLRSAYNAGVTVRVAGSLEISNPEKTVAVAVPAALKVGLSGVSVGKKGHYRRVALVARTWPRETAPVRIRQQALRHGRWQDDARWSGSSSPIGLVRWTGDHLHRHVTYRFVAVRPGDSRNDDSRVVTTPRFVID